MSAQMTKVAWDRGVKNLAICSVSLFVFSGMLVFSLSTILQQPIQETIWIVFAILWFLTFGLFVFGWFYGQSVGGPVLLDCGPHPTRALFAVCGVVSLSLATGGSFAALRNPFEGLGLVGVLFGITFAAYWFILAFGRLQIREQGIWQFWGLLRWKKLASYEWANETGPTLMVQGRTKLPFLGRGALPVPPEQKDAMDALLKEFTVPGP